jgi:hypothetical protein
MSLTLIHEMTADGRHRIVAVADDGTNSASEWVDTRQLAQHLDVYANAGGVDVAPTGIFKIKEVAHQVLA